MNPASFIHSVEAAVAQYPLVALLVAAAGGVLSASTCPCTLPAGVGLVSFVGYQVESVGERARRRYGAALSVSFFAGLMLSLVTLGVIAALLGRVLAQWGAAFAAGAALITLLAGLAALFGPALRRRVPDPLVRRRGGIVGSFLYGTVYSVATITSSAGPLLLLLTIAAAIGRPLYGALIATAFAVGRGLPFLLLGLFAGRVGALVARVERYRRPAETVSGVMLIGLSGYFVWLASVLR
jgi:cytochrome c-type biogenesis protein